MDVMTMLIRHLDCTNAVHLFPEGSNWVTYSTLGRNPYYFPQVRQSGL